MDAVAYCNPFVPVEWLAAHGVQPIWLRPRQSCLGPETEFDRAGGPLNSSVSGRRGVCPLAAAVVDAVWQTEASAVVLTTTCDQMRYAASLLEHQRGVPVFVMNVPSTWQTDVARSLYLAELQRLSRFLVAQGGTAPSKEKLTAVMLRFDRARAALRQVRGGMPAREFADALLTVREQARDFRPRQPNDASDAVPLALAGGPLPPSEQILFDWLQQAGGRIVLDATEWGERTLPRALDISRAQRDPLPELADAYFGAIPDVFRRPNDALYDYLQRELPARHARGLILRRYLWCDLWHAEVARVKAWSPLPVLDLDVADSEASSEARTRGRVEAFLEMLHEPARAGSSDPAPSGKG